MSAYAFGKIVIETSAWIKKLWVILLFKPKGQVWFSRQQMGKHKVGQTMKDMAVKSGLIAATDKKITNHLRRKTCVQKL